MKNLQCAKLLTNNLKLCAGVFVLLLAFQGFIFAQRSSAINSPRERDLRAREMDLRNAERPVKPPSTEREKKLLFEQVSDNFKRIQILNNELMKAAATEEHLDYKRISASADEVSKRANQMQLLLALPPAEEAKTNRKGPDQLDDKQLRLLIAKLDNAVASFVNNALFRNPLVNDIQLAAKASRDLVSIVELSRIVNKSAKSLDKTSVTKPKM